MVYVINKQGQALMPTERFGKVRRLLKNGLAHVVCRIPFTIQLDYDTTNFVQPISLGVDAGSKHIGISATTSEKELYAADVELRNDIVEKLSTRKEQRRTRRNRLRYRKVRFNNRVSSKRKGRLTPSIENKIQTHLTVVEKIHKFLPVTNIIVETAAFDIQKIKNPSISNEEYQKDLYYIFGRRDSGFFDIRKLDGTKVNKGSISCKQMRLIDIRKTIIIEKRIASKFMKKGDRVREIGDTLTGTIVYIANGYADVKYPNMKGVCSLPVQFLEKV